MSISIIVARSKNGVIGHENNIPWKLSSDLKRFRTLTAGHPVVMGRKTYESIFARLGKPLPDRENIILTRQTDFTAPGCLVIHDWNIIKKRGESEEIFVIGGAEIYKLALPDTQIVYLTTVKTSLSGDTFFPTLNQNEWGLIRSEDFIADEKNEYPHIFEVYKRIKK